MSRESVESGGADPTVTALLSAWRRGDDEALERLMPRVYDELRRLARHHLRGERSGRTLTATELVHEAFLRLGGLEMRFADRAHFLAMASRLMRRVLVDRGRARSRLRRGGDMRPAPLDEIEVGEPERSIELQALDQALEQLAELDPRKTQVVDMLFFGGLAYEEAAAALEISRSTLHRDLQFAKAWLYERLGTVDSLG